MAAPVSVVDLRLAHIFAYFDRRPFLDYQLGWSGSDFFKIWFLLQDFYFGVFGREGKWIGKATGSNKTFITALLAQFWCLMCLMDCPLTEQWTVTKASTQIKLRAQSDINCNFSTNIASAKQCNYNASFNPNLNILCKLSRRNSNILITVFLLIHARIDFNQYYKKMVRLISISGHNYYCEE